MYTIDASVWISSFDSGEIGHEDSRKFFDLLSKDDISIYVPTLVLVEIAAAISRSKQKTEEAKKFAASLKQIPNLVLIALDEGLATKAQEIAANQRLRGADAVYAAAAVQTECILVTNDNEQLSRLTGVVDSQTPADAIQALQATDETNEQK